MLPVVIRVSVPMKAWYSASDPPTEEFRVANVAVPASVLLFLRMKLRKPVKTGEGILGSLR